MRHFTALAIPALSVALLALNPLPGHAQGNPPASTPPAANSEKPQLFTLDVRDAPFRQTLDQLFKAAGVNYTVASDVPDTRVTIRAKDLPLDQMLRTLLIQGSQEGKRLTYTREGGVYAIRVVALPPAPRELEPVPVVYRRVDELVPQLQPLFPQAEFISTPGSNTLLLRTDVQTVGEIRNVVRVLDVRPAEYLVKAEVIIATDGNRKTGNALLSTMVQVTAGQEAEGEDKTTGTPAQTAKLLLNVKVTPLGDGSVEVANRWDLSLPLNVSGGANKPGGLVRLEKRSSTVSRLRPGDTMPVGGTILKQYGMNGELLLFLTVTPIPESPARP